MSVWYILDPKYYVVGRFGDEGMTNSMVIELGLDMERGRLVINMSDIEKL